VAPSSHAKGLATRRSILIDTAVCFAAPAIVRAANLMPVRSLLFILDANHTGYCERLLFQALRGDLRCGSMTTWLNGKIVSETEALRILGAQLGDAASPSQNHSS